MAASGRSSTIHPKVEFLPKGKRGSCSIFVSLEPIRPKSMRTLPKNISSKLKEYDCKGCNISPQQPSTTNRTTHSIEVERAVYHLSTFQISGTWLSPCYWRDHLNNPLATKQICWSMNVNKNIMSVSWRCPDETKTNPISTTNLIKIDLCDYPSFVFRLVLESNNNKSSSSPHILGKSFSCFLHGNINGRLIRR